MKPFFPAAKYSKMFPTAFNYSHSYQAGWLANKLIDVDKFLIGVTGGRE